MRNERISHEADGTNILPKTREKSAPPIDKRHDKFQLGYNPMAMSDFEKNCILRERQERTEATEKYIKGIQGRDGGCFPDDQVKHEVTVPFNVKSTY